MKRFVSNPFNIPFLTSLQQSIFKHYSIKFKIAYNHFRFEFNAFREASETGAISTIYNFKRSIKDNIDTMIADPDHALFGYNREVVSGAISALANNLHNRDYSYIKRDTWSFRLKTDFEYDRFSENKIRVEIPMPKSYVGYDDADIGIRFSCFLDFKNIKEIELLMIDGAWKIKIHEDNEDRLIYFTYN